MRGLALRIHVTRAIETTVGLPAGEVEGLPDDSHAVCHDLYTLPDGVLREHKGNLSPGSLRQLERAIQVALGLD